MGAIEPAFWRNLCRELDLEHYNDAQMDDALQDEIRGALAARFATKTRNEWADQLGPADCCVAPVNTVAEAIDDQQYVARGMVVEADHATEGHFRQTGPVWAGTTAPDGPYPVREGTVTDTAELLAEAGYQQATIDNLLENGVIA